MGKGILNFKEMKHIHDCGCSGREHCGPREQATPSITPESPVLVLPPDPLQEGYN